MDVAFISSTLYTSMDILTLSTLSLLFTGTVCSSLLHAGPVGVIMCRQKCYTTVGCKLYTYIPCELTCYSGEKGSNTRDTVTHVMKESFELKQKMKDGCKPKSRILITRSKNPVCINNKKKTRRNLSDKRFISQRELRRLLGLGYKRFAGVHCIYLWKLHKVLKSWDDAMKQCREEGGLLAQMKEKVKWDVMPFLFGFNLDLFLINRRIWIGLRHNTNEDKFRWADGTKLKDNSRWRKVTEPTDKVVGKDKDCGCVIYTNYQLKLCDWMCSRRSFFLCELKVSVLKSGAARP